jgi:26S proteasome regulatory subunit N6
VGLQWRLNAVQCQEGMTAMEVDQAGPMTQGGNAMDVDEAVDKRFEDLLEKAKDMEVKSPDNAAQAYKKIIFNEEDIDDPTARGREQAIYALGEFLVKQGKAQDLQNLAMDLRPVFNDLPKAKTAKIVRTLIDLLSKIPGTRALQIDMCHQTVEWCKEGKRNFLRQRIETRLASLLLEDSKYDKSLELLGKLLSEVKRLDDKLLLVEIFLIECRTHYAVQNVPKSKAALTAAKTNANAIHCPPLLQADIDSWSGILSAREKDFRTAYSYFYEAFEAFNAADKGAKAKENMKFMLLTKIMMNRPQETKAITNSKSGLKYDGPEIEAMQAVAAAHEERSLKTFESVLLQYKGQLELDPIIKHHLTDLNETLLEQNISRILEPFSRVEISHVAELMELPLPRIQNKLREMILDGKLNGTLDQGIGVLIVFEQEQIRSTYNNALKTIKNTSEVLDTLYGISKQLN